MVYPEAVYLSEPETTTGNSQPDKTLKAKAEEIRKQVEEIYCMTNAIRNKLFGLIPLNEIPLNEGPCDTKECLETDLSDIKEILSATAGILETVRDKI